MNTLLTYDLFRRAGWPEEQARDAAKLLLTVDDKQELATKLDLADLKTEVVALRGEFSTMKWMLGALIALVSTLVVNLLIRAIWVAERGI